MQNNWWKIIADQFPTKSPIELKITLLYPCTERKTDNLSTSETGRGGSESWSWRRHWIYGSGKTSALVDKYWPAFTHNPSRLVIAFKTRFAFRWCVFSQILFFSAWLFFHFSLFCTNCTWSQNPIRLMRSKNQISTDFETSTKYH